jgi:hypothetical protein
MCTLHLFMYDSSLRRAFSQTWKKTSTSKCVQRIAELRGVCCWFHLRRRLWSHPVLSAVDWPLFGLFNVLLLFFGDPPTGNLDLVGGRVLSMQQVTKLGTTLSCVVIPTSDHAPFELAKFHRVANHGDYFGKDSRFGCPGGSLRDRPWTCQR